MPALCPFQQNRTEAWRLLNLASEWLPCVKVFGEYGGHHHALDVLRALVKHMNRHTGFCFPSVARLARVTGLGERTVRRALVRLKVLRIISWVKRPKNDPGQGHRQDSNAYALLPSSGWLGYRDPTPPPPRPDSWGKAEPLPPLLDQAQAFAREGGTVEAVASLLESDPADRFARRFASLVRWRGLRVLLDIKLETIPRPIWPSGSVGHDFTIPRRARA